MKTPLISFVPESLRCETDPRGYRWVDLGIEGNKVLVVNAYGDNLYIPSRPHYPLCDQAGMYKVFRSVEETFEGILVFANQYGGLLTNKAPLPTDVLGNTKKKETPTYDTFFRFRDEIFEMRLAETLWACVEDNEDGELSECIIITLADHASDSTIHFLPESLLSTKLPKSFRKQQLLASKSVNSELLELGRRQDFFALAKYIICQKIHEHLENIPVEVRWDKAESRPSLQVAPRNLLEGIWLQFADVVHNKKPIRQCDQCEKWFDPTAGRGRKDRIFCSNACRSKAYRERQEQARNLHAEGKPLEDIAEFLRSDVDTVTKWILAKTDD